MLRAIAPFVDSIETVMKLLGTYEFLPSDDMLIKGGKLVCKDESPIQEVIFSNYLKSIVVKLNCTKITFSYAQMFCFFYVDTILRS